MKQLVARYRALPEGDRKEVPALLNAIGKLEVVAGDFDAAQKDFQAVALLEQDNKGQAEAHYNAYLASLEKRDWPGGHSGTRQGGQARRQAVRPLPGGQVSADAHPGRGRLRRGVPVQAQVHGRPGGREDAGSGRPGPRRRQGVHGGPGAASTGASRHHSHQRCGYVDAAKKSRPYILMDYFQGGTLEEHVKKHGPLAADDLIAVGRQVADGLQAAHAKGILHRDVKPANLLVHRGREGLEGQGDRLRPGPAAKGRPEEYERQHARKARRSSARASPARWTTRPRSRWASARASPRPLFRCVRVGEDLLLRPVPDDAAADEALAERADAAGGTAGEVPGRRPQEKAPRLCGRSCRP